MPQFIVYACPVGLLAQQIESYFEVSKQRCGLNAAHAYMPHCTLTGFFVDEVGAVAQYTRTLETSLAQSQPIPIPAITVEKLAFNPDWHGLVLQADWLKRLVKTFAAQANSPTRKEALRLKDWLHLSLAYEFDPTQAPVLQALANELIDLSAPVSWQLRFYQRSAENNWTCHRLWVL